MNYYKTNMVVTLNRHKVVRGSGFSTNVEIYIFM